jgi:DNA-binding transcriptional MerR regulator
MGLLKVGELAQGSGLTVRTLHHYDQIGLLCPSARSDAGYRLYGRDDIARLHAIQALRGLGLALKDIGPMLAGDGAALPRLLQRQVRALDRQISQATELRGQLALLLAKVGAGEQPAMADWLQALQRMTAMGRHFSAAEIRRIHDNWPRVADEWAPLMAEVQALMDAGVPPDDDRVQPLANRWMGLIHHWMDGDFDLIDRWGRMYLQEPGARARPGPGIAMVRYIERVTERRMAAWLRHFSLAELSRLRWVPRARTQALADALQRLVDQGVPPQAPQARALAAQAHALMLERMGGDPALTARLDAAMTAEPLLAVGTALPAPLRAYLAEVARAMPQAAQPARRRRA